MLDIDDRSVPATFRDMVFADRRRAARLIVNVQDEIDPQFRIATPEGDYWLAVTLPRETRERFAVLKRVSLFHGVEAGAMLHSCEQAHGAGLRVRARRVA